jgi:hypothetical protein
MPRIPGEGCGRPQKGKYIGEPASAEQS